MIRKAAVAGMFYPDTKMEIEHLLKSFFEKCEKKQVKNVKALIVPHAGYVYSGIVAASGYYLIKGNNYKRVIILGPSHHIPFFGAAFDTNDYWETPLGKVKVSNFHSMKIKLLPEAHIQEHSIEVQVPFLQYVLKDFTICPISLGGYSETIVEDIETNLADSLLIVSSDLSHYKPYNEAVKIDKITIKNILSLKHIEADDACGADGINILIDIAKRKKWKATLIDYKNSGDTSGVKSGVVGYCAIAFY